MQTPSPTYVCVSVCAQEEREERVHTHCLALDSFCGGRGGAESGACFRGGERAAKQRTQDCTPKAHCVSVHRYTCVPRHLERNCLCTEEVMEHRQLHVFGLDDLSHRPCGSSSFFLRPAQISILSQTYLTIPLLIWRQYISFYACCPYVIINSISFHSKDISFWMINYVISLIARGY